MFRRVPPRCVRAHRGITRQGLEKLRVDAKARAPLPDRSTESSSRVAVSHMKSIAILVEILVALGLGPRPVWLVDQGKSPVAVEADFV